MRENTQPPLPADIDKTGAIKVHSVFRTLQGEGPFCGERALFIRLYGCNLQCPGCDTEYTADYKLVTDRFMLAEVVRHNWPRGGLIVITGGEPFRQNIVPSVVRLLKAGYRVQVETNGVLSPNLKLLHTWINDGAFTIVCSPKTSRISEEIHSLAKAFKYVLRVGEVDEDGLPLRALMHRASPRVARPRRGALVYVQPMDEDDQEANLLNRQAAVTSALNHGHTLQLQIHKLCNLE